ncbi:MAG: FadR family transcriptional regulator [Clostridiales bacterium]|nr:FadR family transcriptional regulator [Clostridiales bacterium]
MNTTENFRVKRMPVHEQVFDSLKKAISEGRWAVGEKIPTEMDLSEMFGVNRLTVRMALQRLIGMGLLETRVGDGTYVKRFSFRDYINNVSEFYLTPDLMDDILEYRNSIEMGALRLAVKRATDAEVEELHEICDQMDAAKAAYIKQTEAPLLQDFLDLDIRFHEKICFLSHNDLYIYSFDLMRNILYKYMESLVRDRTNAWISNAAKENPDDDKHRRVYLALRARDMEKCMREYSDIIDYRVSYY